MCVPTNVTVLFCVLVKYTSASWMEITSNAPPTVLSHEYVVNGALLTNDEGLYKEFKFIQNARVIILGPHRVVILFCEV